MKPIRKYIYVFMLLPLLVCLTACQSHRDKQFQGQLMSDDSRSLYAPLLGGHQALVKELGKQDAQQLSFRLTDDGAEQIENPAEHPDFWTDAVATFFRIEHEGDTQWLYLNPRFMRLENLTQTRTWATDCVPGTDGHFSIYRAIALGDNWFNRPIHREVLRYDFQLVDGQIQPVKVSRMTQSDSDKALPLPLPQRDLLVYVDHRDDDALHLTVQNLKNGATHWLVPNRAYQTTNPAVTEDGNLIFAGNPDGYFRLYQMDWETGQHTPYDAGYPKPDDGDFVLTTAYAGGRFQPTVAAVPKTLNLAQICSLTASGNPEVNRLRALYVAALFEAGEARLRHYPVLTSLFSYTSIVGVFLDDPAITTGDFLAEHVARGIFGVAQPLFDFKRNEALHRAGQWRAKLSRALIEDELNKQVAAAASLYFEAQYYRNLIEVDKAILQVTTERERFYRKQENDGGSLREQTLAAANISTGIKAELSAHRNRYAYLIDELRRVCGLAEDAPLNLIAEGWKFEHYQVPSMERLREIALLNHPQLDVVRHKLPEMFNTYLAGPDIRPTGYYSDRYGQSRRHFKDAIDDYINHSFNVNYPVMTAKARRLHENQWQATLEAYEIARQHQRRRVLNRLREARMNLRDAQEDWQAKRATAAYRAEALRVQRVYHRYGHPNPETNLKALSQNEAAFDFLIAHRKSLDVQRDLAVRYAALWQAMGLAKRIPAESAGLRPAVQRQEQASIWVWQTPNLTGNLKSIMTFVEDAAAWGVTRAYVYVGARGEFLKDRAGKDFERFLIEAAGGGIEVWALIGEPGWLQDGGLDKLQTVHTAILDFNGKRLQGEASLRGIKVDLEPHAEPAWDTSADYRRSTNKQYLKLVEALALTSALPVWVDCPPKYFTTDNGKLGRELGLLVDGITVMAYDHRLKHVETLARKALEAAAVPVEVGIELSAKAPAAASLNKLENTTIQKWMNTSRQKFREYPGFSGYAIHDYISITEKKGPNQ